jgi:outer membrane autotransporter protein
VTSVAAATGNYKVRIDNATGAGSVADYKGKELIYVNDTNSTATFSAANKADLGAYTYQAQQQGNTVVLQQMELTDYANMALSIPSANTNIWNLEQDTVGTRLTNARHGLVDNGGAWVSYFGGSFDATTAPSATIRMLTASWLVLIPKLMVTTLSGLSVLQQASRKVI